MAGIDDQLSADIAATRGDRKLIAQWVLTASFVIIGGISLAVAIVAIIGYLQPAGGALAAEDATAGLTELLNTLLPVFGAWVGW